MFVRVNAIFNTWGVILHEGRIGGLRDNEGRQVSWRHFYAGRKTNIQDVFVISTLGIVVLSLRQHIDGWLNTEET